VRLICDGRERGLASYLPDSDRGQLLRPVPLLLLLCVCVGICCLHLDPLHFQSAAFGKPKVEWHWEMPTPDAVARHTSLHDTCLLGYEIHAHILHTRLRMWSDFDVFHAGLLQMPPRATGNPRFLSPRSLTSPNTAGPSSARGFFDRGGGGRDSHSSAALHYAGTRGGVVGGERSMPGTSDVFAGAATGSGSPYASRSSYASSGSGHSRERAASAHVPNPGYRTARGDYAAPYGGMSVSRYGAGMTHHLVGSGAR